MAHARNRSEWSLKGRGAPAGTRARADLAIAVVIFLLGAGASAAREFRIGDWRAYALVGPPDLDAQVQYVAFSGDQGLFAAWLPNQRDLAAVVEREAALLSRFQLRVVNLEGPFPGSSGAPLEKRVDDAQLYSLTAAGYDVVGRANNHGLDLGPEGVRYTTERLVAAGLKTIGERNSPVFHWLAAQSRIDISALADTLDRPDPGHLILTLSDEDLALARREMEGADFRIAFVHLGSASRFTSPHERAQVKRLLDAGFGLVVCTGAHFIKGFLMETGRPVAYGIGDNLTSLDYSRSDTEPLGMHLVAGFKGGKLHQVFAIPFHNDIRRARAGPLDDAAFGHFVRTLQERSVADATKYYADDSTWKALIRSLSGLGPSGLTRLRPRHVVYAARIVIQQRPWWIGTAGLLLIVIAAVMVRRRSSRMRKANREA